MHSLHSQAGACARRGQQELWPVGIHLLAPRQSQAACPDPTDSNSCRLALSWGHGKPTAGCVGHPPVHVPGLGQLLPSVLQTQPVPNPLAYFLHRSPWWFHRFEVLSNHFVELLVPFFIFLGRRMCLLHGALQVLFQVGAMPGWPCQLQAWLSLSRVQSPGCSGKGVLDDHGPLAPVLLGRCPQGRPRVETLLTFLYGLSAWTSTLLVFFFFFSSLFLIYLKETHTVVNQLTLPSTGSLYKWL